MSLDAYKLFEEDSKTICIVIGLGLVGSAISKYLSYFALPLPGNTSNEDTWLNAERLATDIILASDYQANQRIELIWTAGKAGFSADENEMQKEFSFYKSVLELVQSKIGDKLNVSLISSAGGLYENSTFVNDIEDVSPQRPYALYKLKQENFLSQSGINSRIYRVSTAYGLGGKRVGLIRALLQSCISRQPVTIYASRDTLRDYIYNTDIARFVVNNILQNTAGCIHILANGRPVSIQALLSSVGRATGKQAVISFLPDDSNTKNILFHTNLLINQPAKTSLEEGVSLLYRRSL